MNKILQQKLYDAYPLIFVQKDLPMSQTCMCWGIDCGDGWYNLLDTLCAELQHSVINGHPQVQAVQVKEKLGTLRFYTNGEDDFQEGAIWLAESLSRKTCEECGNVATTKTKRGWISTRCERCENANI